MSQHTGRRPSLASTRSDVCAFKSGNGAGAPAPAIHEHGHSHEHGHTHEIMEHPGRFGERDLPNYAARHWNERAFTVGIGGCVDLLTAGLSALERRRSSWRCAASCETTTTSAL